MHSVSACHPVAVPGSVTPRFRGPGQDSIASFSQGALSVFGAAAELVKGGGQFREVLGSRLCSAAGSPRDGRSCVRCRRIPGPNTYSCAVANGVSPLALGHIHPVHRATRIIPRFEKPCMGTLGNAEASGNFVFAQHRVALSHCSGARQNLCLSRRSRAQDDELIAAVAGHDVDCRDFCSRAALRGHQIALEVAPW